MAGSLVTAAHTSSASAICGIASARTKETASILLTPVVASWSISAIFAAGRHRVLVLQPIPGPDFAQRDPRRQIGHGRLLTGPARPGPASR